ncbi:MAG: Rid family hydrolase [Balneolaceae bacterium]|nr:Rid family hydrolase [Balneolaceae bacterium]
MEKNIASNGKKSDITVYEMTEGEKEEMLKLGILSEEEEFQPFEMSAFHKKRSPIEKKAVHATNVLNEAYNYYKPSSFSRAIRLDLGAYTVVLISGTASVNEEGKTAHVGDFRAQCWRTFRNISELLESEDMSWHDVVRTSCYLRDIERDYEDFNEVRTQFYSWLKLDPLPASTGIQARLCWDTLLVEIEAIAVCKNE